MYHAVGVADGDPASEDYTVSIARFEAQLGALCGVRSPSAAWLLAGASTAPAGAGPWALVTFDDGFESVLTEGAPRLQAAGIEASLLFITAGHLGRPGYLAAGQVKELLGAGVVVGAHGLTHRYLTDLPLEELRRELREPRARLEALTGYPVWAFSAPGGRIDRRVAQEAWRAGYRALYGSRPGLAPLEGPAPEVLPRVAVTEQTAPEALGRWVAGDVREALMARVRYEALRAPKRLLGNGGYDALRGAVLGALRGRR
jgi:peptidoglycan/xylan/chitin deacetylase (PgdA/CDA1 family)